MHAGYSQPSGAPAFPAQPMLNFWVAGTLSLGFSSAKNLPPATSDKCPSEKSPFGKIALDIGQDELSANVSHRMRKKGLKQDSHQ